MSTEDDHSPLSIVEYSNIESSFNFNNEHQLSLRPNSTPVLSPFPYSRPEAILSFDQETTSYSPSYKHGIHPSYSWINRHHSTLYTPKLFRQPYYPTYQQDSTINLIDASIIHQSQYQLFSDLHQLPPVIPQLNRTKSSQLTRKTPVSNSSPDPLKPHPCGEPNCPLFFRRVEHARRHRDGVHLKLRPFSCPIDQCNKKFARSDNLRQHIRSIHRTSPK